MKRRHESPKGALRAPLDEVLRGPANVRLLRELAAEPRFFAPGELARRTGLTRATVYRALDRLFDAGFIEYESSGALRCRFRTDHPLADSLSRLFTAEHQRFLTIRDGIRNVVEELEPPPVSAWIERSVAVGTDDFGDPLVVGLLDTPEHLDEHVEMLQERLIDLQREQDVTIEIRGRTRADLGALPAEDKEGLAEALPLYGPPVDSFIAPEKYRRQRPARNHQDLEDLSLRYAEAIAKRIRKEPELIERARAWLRSRMAQASKPEVRELREWERVLESTTPARLSRFLVDSSERAVRLRQTNPFLDVLTQEERRELAQEREP